MSERAELPWWATLLLIPLLNLAAAFAVSAVILVAIGENPFQAGAIILRGALFSGEGIGYTLFYATNFIFTGLAFAIAFHAGLFNIGAEGQAYVAGLGVALVCLSFDSRGEVNAVTEAAGRLGGAIDVNPPQDHGFMFARSFTDLDGHLWEPMWMDPAVAEGSAHVSEAEASA